MTKIFNSEIECSNEVQRLKLLQKHHPLRPEVIPPELANSSQWIVWAYEVGGRKNGKFGPDKIAYQARNPWLKSSRWNTSDWSDLTTALQCVNDNPHIDGIGYFFSKDDGLTGIDFDNCRDLKTGRIRKEYQFWIDKLNGYTEVSPSGTGIKVWVKGTIDSKYFRNDESTGFRIQNFADGIIEIYRRGQYFTVTTQFLERFEHIKPAQEELDVLSEFYHSRTHNTLSGGWVSGEHVPDVVGNLPEHAKARLGESPINDIQFSPDGTRLAVARGIGIWIYDADTGKELFLLGGHTQNVTSVIFSPSGHKLASGGQDGTIRLWDVTTGTHLKTFTMNNINDIVYLTFSPDRCRVATIDADDSPYLGEGLDSSPSSLRLWEIATGKLCQTIAGNILQVVFSQDGRTLIISECDWNGDFSIGLWDTVRGIRLKTLTKTGSANSIDFSSDGRTLALGNHPWYSGGIRLWDVTKEVQLKTFIGSEELESVHSLAFSSDGSMLANVCRNSTIYLWNVDTGEHVKTFTGHTAAISNLCFSPDGNTLASGCEDGTVLLWNVNMDNDNTISTTMPAASPVPVPNAIIDNKAILAEEESEFVNDTFQIDSTHVDVTYEERDSSWIATAKATDTITGVSRYGAYEQSKVVNGFFDPSAATKARHKAKRNAIRMLKRAQIQSICEERGITTLCHFTRIENLQNILQQGLLGRSVLETRGQQSLFNDHDRADGHKETICLSISFPNYQMFYSIREEKKEAHEVGDSQWIVLLLDPKVLWELDCAFCQRNAAHRNVSSIPLENRRKPEALKGMFEDFYNIRHQDLPIPQNYPTHPQAEVLVFDSIPGQFIKAIHFWHETTLEKCRSYAESYSQMFSVNRQYFTYRADYEVWRPTNFNNEGIPLSYIAENDVDDTSLSVPIDEDDIPF